MITTNQKPEEIHLEDAHASLVQAAKIAHLTISKLIDSLEEIISSKTYSIFLDSYHRFVV
jgi:hypothetical protein